MLCSLKDSLSCSRLVEMGVHWFHLFMHKTAAFFLYFYIYSCC
uniref:Uncharacterized protein n=1 Tax=Arundo donax TaxID=35708 RepID=A0A0A9CG15_ARUDO